MSAARHINPNQLRMFMTAGELHGMHSIDVQQTSESRYGGAWKSMDAMWAAKSRENKADAKGGFDLKKSIAEQGVHVPVELTSGSDVQGEVIQDGHHRIQAAFEHDPQMLLPVEHHSLDVRYGRGRYEGPADPVIPGWKNVDRFPSMP